MQFLRVYRGRLAFQVSKKEKLLFLKTLRLYPLIPAAHQRLSKSEERPEDQQLLDDALAIQRAANKKQMLALVNSKSRFRKNEEGYRFSLKPEEIEFLLQVLNDVRVGSWLLLGSPLERAEIMAALNDDNARHFWAMELAGHFQMVLLTAKSKK